MYSPTVRRALLNLVNGRAGSHYNGKGRCETAVPCFTNPNKILKNRVEFSVCIENAVILEARWQAFGDPVAIAACSWCVEQVKGMHIVDLIHKVTPERMAMELDIASPSDISAGCLTAIKALINALNDYESRENS